MVIKCYLILAIQHRRAASKIWNRVADNIYCFPFCVNQYKNGKMETVPGSIISTSYKYYYSHSKPSWDREGKMQKYIFELVILSSIFQNFGFPCAQSSLLLQIRSNLHLTESIIGVYLHSYWSSWCICQCSVIAGCRSFHCSLPVTLVRLIHHLSFFWCLRHSCLSR